MNRGIGGLLLVTALVGASWVQAGLWEDIYHGMEIVATPSGYPVTRSGGTAANGNRIGRLRILPDNVGQGYSLDFQRSFGVDSFGNAEVLDLGAYELQLSGTIASTLSYTSRGMLIGNAEVQASNLSYAVRAKTGAQDIELTGLLNTSGSLEVNQFGFYTLDLDVSNTNSQWTADGVVVDASDPTNFDIGPISIKGNVFIDAFAVMLGSVGVDTSFLDPFVNKSPADELAAAIQEQLSSVDLLSKFQSYASTVGAESDGTLGYGPTPSVTDLSLAQSASITPSDLTTVPEPGTMLLVMLGGGLLAVRWRRL